MMDALFGTTPIPAEEDYEDEEVFPDFAQVPLDQAPDQTLDGYTGIDLSAFGLRNDALDAF